MSASYSIMDITAFTECNNDTTQKQQFRVNTMIELKNRATTSDNTSTLLSQKYRTR
jgi:hypothetical protein